MNEHQPRLDSALFIGAPRREPVPLPFDELLKHHCEVRDATARTIHVERDLSDDLATFVATLSFVYAFNSYKAIGLVLPELYHESGAVILRQLWEVSLNLHWVERDPGTRAQDFCSYTLMEYRKLIQKSGDASSLNGFDDATREFQARFHYRDRKRRDQRHSSFACKSTHDRAAELGDPWKREYELVYNLASLHAHGAPGAILQPHFRQYYPSPVVEERNSAALIAILSIKVLVRDLQLLQRAGIIENCDEVDAAFASFQKTMDRQSD